jgi:hypothetical protein
MNKHDFKIIYSMHLDQYFRCMFQLNALKIHDSIVTALPHVST